MTDIVAEFQKQQYVYLPEFLDRENCGQLTQELKNLVSQGASTKDTQCPLSDAVYGAPAFDSLLEQLVPYFEQAIGKKLLPTYSYARIYRVGDELKNHRDRPSCEISATITLGFRGDIWPIFMAKPSITDTGVTVVDENNNTHFVENISKIEMNIGDVVLYHGQEVFHWREKYHGEWQAQVFLHYVDANGVNTAEKYDKRDKLSHHYTSEKDREDLYWFYSDALSVDACQKIIQGCEKQKMDKAGIGVNDTNNLDYEIRDVNRLSLPTYRGIGATMAGIGLDANYKVWKFNVTHADQTDYLKYDKNGHYKTHVDTFLNSKIDPSRKLTILLFLNDDFEGGRLYLQAGHEKIYPPQQPGTIIVFPSFIPHGVEPVTQGIRRSIVTWLVGPWFH